MVKQMTKNNSFYKGNNIINDTYKDRMFNYFNPYGYNFESNLKDRINTDISSQKSKSHHDRNSMKK